jgi:hypothetical protein
MRTTLVSVPTGTQPLDGAFYEPEGGAAAGAAIVSSWLERALKRQGEA